MQLGSSCCKNCPVLIQFVSANDTNRYRNLRSTLERLRRWMSQSSAELRTRLSFRRWPVASTSFTSVVRCTSSVSWSGASNRFDCIFMAILFIDDWFIFSATLYATLCQNLTGCFSIPRKKTNPETVRFRYSSYPLLIQFYQRWFFFFASLNKWVEIWYTCGRLLQHAP